MQIALQKQFSYYSNASWSYVYFPNIKNMTQAYDGNNPLSYKQTDNKLMEALHNLEHWFLRLHSRKY